MVKLEKIYQFMLRIEQKQQDSKKKEEDIFLEFIN